MRKHGRRSERVKRLREHSVAFEERRIKWSACSQPVGDLEEFLLHQNVSLSFELERARAAHFEHLQSLIENADEIEVAEINKLGDRLFTNRCGPQQLYGSTGTTARKEATASWNGEAVDPDKPADLVEKLTSSALGCCWVLTRFEELRAHLERRGGFWRSPDKLKMIRLLGFQPLDAADQEEVAVIFTASHALRPVGKAFDELISETGITAHERYVKEVRARWKGLVGPDEPERARAILIDLIEQNVERIEGILAEHDENAAEHAERTINRLGVDRRPEGKLTREYGLRCHNVLFRTSETYRKHQAKRLNGKMQDERGTMTDDEWAARPVLRAGDRMVATMDGQPDAPQVAGRALRPVRGVLGGPADSIPSPEPAELPGSGAGEAGRTLVEEATGTVAAAAATADCGKSGPGTGAKFTNEANFSEHAGIAKTHKNKAISADFGVEPGLDKMKTKPIRARGPRGAGTPGFKSQLSSLVSQVSNLESLISSLNSQVPDLEPEDAGPGKSNPDSCDANLGLREGGLAGANGVVGTGGAPGTPSPSESAALSESGAGLTGRTLVETLDEATGTVAAAAATADCGKSGPGTGAKITSEPKFSEHAGIAKTHKNKGISPDFGVEPGLDKMETKPIRARGPSFKTQVSNWIEPRSTRAELEEVAQAGGCQLEA